MSTAPARYRLASPDRRVAGGARDAAGQVHVPAQAEEIERAPALLEPFAQQQTEERSR
jgi:hypothetical protein